VYGNATNSVAKAQFKLLTRICGWVGEFDLHRAGRCGAGDGLIASKLGSYKSPAIPVGAELARDSYIKDTTELETQPRSEGTDDNSNGLLLRRWLRSSRGVAPKKLR